MKERGQGGLCGSPCQSHALWGSFLRRRLASLSMGAGTPAAGPLALRGIPGQLVEREQGPCCAGV